MLKLTSNNNNTSESDPHSYEVTQAVTESDQLQFSLSVSHQRYIIQYGEFGNT